MYCYMHLQNAFFYKISQSLHELPLLTFHHNPTALMLSTCNQYHAQLTKSFYVSTFASIFICNNLSPYVQADDKSHSL